MFKARLLLVYPLIFIVSLYTTLVLTILWGWFVSSALHVPEIGFWMMYGIVLVVRLLFDPGVDKMLHEDKRWERLNAAILALAPDDRREDVLAELKEEEVDLWILAGATTFSQFVGSSFVLGIGFMVHIFAS